MIPYFTITFLMSYLVHLSQSDLRLQQSFSCQHHLLPCLKALQAVAMPRTLRESALLAWLQANQAQARQALSNWWLASQDSSYLGLSKLLPPAEKADQILHVGGGC